MGAPYPFHLATPQALPGVEAGVVHEVVGGSVSAWVWQALAEEAAVIWVGAACWPNGWTQRVEAQRIELFVHAAGWRERVMAVEAALRCSAVGGVVVDGRGFDMTATRRLPLAAERSSATLMMVRPANEAGRASAAGVRWRVDPVVTDGDRPRFLLQLLRRKGRRPITPGAGHGLTSFTDNFHINTVNIDTVNEQPRQWLLEWNPADGVRVVDDVGDRPGTQATSATA